VSSFYGGADIVRETLIQPRRNRRVLRLYKCIGTQRLASVAGNLVVYGASCFTGLDLRITLAPVGSQEPLQLGPRWRGKGGRRE
jgi:hypothetical protein